MKPAPFDYYAPTSLPEALELLAQRGDSAKLLAGGQSLGPLLNMRLAQPEALIDLNRLKELSYLRVEHDGSLAIGALTRQRQVERTPEVARGWPLLAEAVPWIGHLTIRNRGTVGGSLAHADPAAELPAVACALDARFRLLGPNGERVVGPSDFFLDLLTTTLEPDELLAEVRCPPTPPRTGHAWLEFARRHGDYAIVGVAAVLSLDEAQRCRAAWVVLTGVSGTPFSAAEAATMMVGETPGEALIQAVAEQAARDCEPESDLHASAAYRRHLVRVLTRRALARAWERAQGAGDGA